MITTSRLYNFDDPKAIDFDLMIQEFNNLKSGQVAHIPVYDFSTHSRKEDVFTMIKPEQVSVLIVEGIFALYNERILCEYDYTIYIKEDLDICLVRRIKRDMSERNRSIGSILHQWLEHVRPSIQAFVLEQEHRANAVITNVTTSATTIEPSSELIEAIEAIRKICRSKA